MSRSMTATPTLVSVWTVVLDGATIHEGLDFTDALVARRAKGGDIVRVDTDKSPWDSISGAR
jgi:hypothetical protein